MAISVYRWTDGPYLAFTDHNERRYVLEHVHAVTLFERMHAHLCDAPNRNLIVNRRFTRDPQRDLTVIDMYLQDCENLVEIMTKSSPVLLVTPAESCTLLRLAVEHGSMVRPQSERDFSTFMQESALSAMTNPQGSTWASIG